MPPADLVLLGGVKGLQSVEPEKRKPLLVPAPAQQWVGCRPRILAHAEGSSPKDTPEKPKPGGHCLILELPVGGGTAKAKPP